MSLPAAGPVEFVMTSDQLARIERAYGRSARERVQEWRDLMARHGGDAEREKLMAVNQFFNRLDFVDDSIHWNQQDYWATPVEMLVTAGGDCEDFSIAKYFTLKAMGVDESKLRLTYVKSLRLNQAHMVLTYFPTPASEPLVLDNLSSDIEPAGRRRDLLPVYSFNGDGLWLAKKRESSGRLVGPADRLGLWRDLLQRLHQQP
ncbi:MAG: sulfate adenylyltransferase [Methylococcaceae bacterium]|nr:sulfate adenylyltransferase [Methylococcaceae bacterium]